jgi:poly [ADP-ribose] polymerase
MALMDVAYGKPYDAYSFDSKYYNFDYDRLQRACPGANCLHAHAGTMLRNDEIIVYKQEQSTIHYLVEIKN